MFFTLEMRSTVALMYLDHVPFLSVVVMDRGGGLMYGSTDLTDAIVERGGPIWDGYVNVG
jgi:hypothetical protein